MTEHIGLSAVKAVQYLFDAGGTVSKNKLFKLFGPDILERISPSTVARHKSMVWLTLEGVYEHIMSIDEVFAFAATRDSYGSPIRASHASKQDIKDGLVVKEVIKGYVWYWKKNRDEVKLEMRRLGHKQGESKRSFGSYRYNTFVGFYEAKLIAGARYESFSLTAKKQAADTIGRISVGEQAVVRLLAKDVAPKEVKVAKRAMIRRRTAIKNAVQYRRARVVKEAKKLELDNKCALAVEEAVKAIAKVEAKIREVIEAARARIKVLATYEPTSQEDFRSMARLLVQGRKAKAKEAPKTTEMPILPEEVRVALWKHPTAAGRIVFLGILGYEPKIIKAVLGIKANSHVSNVFAKHGVKQKREEFKKAQEEAERNKK